MTLLTRAETLAFSPETARGLRSAGFTLGFLSIVGVLGLGTFGGGGFQPWLLILAAVAFLPALLLLALSHTLPARKPVSVLLIWAICGFSFLLVRRTPSAAEGVEPQWLVTPMIWVVAVVEFVLAVGLAWFAWHLYRKGAFSGVAG
ncbi:hypothetical protein [Vannielia litorea]|uniref:Uncharacterized protein n=1 Tax=Vannielia litorea TaxID=1217970 RepID=A0A1N6E6C0_9RHOB|nr:hypothetical protein [Vannielia litorea]SIN78568.1 hypothetical protein SAMN05444002_0385 [Vannielia litorea]